MANDKRATRRIEIALREAQGLGDPQPRTPKNDDQLTYPGPWIPRPGWRMTATISSIRGGSAG